MHPFLINPVSTLLFWQSIGRCCFNLSITCVPLWTIPLCKLQSTLALFQIVVSGPWSTTTNFGIVSTLVFVGPRGPDPIFTCPCPTLIPYYPDDWQDFSNSFWSSCWLIIFVDNSPMFVCWHFSKCIFHKKAVQWTASRSSKLQQ